MVDRYEELSIQLGGPGSGNYGHKGRPGERGGSADDGIPNKSASPDPSSMKGQTVQKLKALRKNFAARAQEVYDNWEPGEFDEYAGGGICQDIADVISDEAIKYGYETTTLSAQVGEQHVWAVVKTDDGIFEVDIPYSIYERGGGYTWHKLPNVQFREGDVYVNLLGPVEDWDQYLEAW
jgi:hypothetical protein